MFHSWYRSVVVTFVVVFVVSVGGCDVLDDSSGPGDSDSQEIRYRGRSIEQPNIVPPEDDLSDDDNPPAEDPPSIASAHNDFFPLQIGNRWKYSYLAGYGNAHHPFSDSTNAVFSWEVVDITQRTDTTDYTIEEIFSGIRFYSVRVEPGHYDWAPPVTMNCTIRFVISEATDSLSTSFHPLVAPDCIRFYIPGRTPDRHKIYWREVPVARYFDVPSDTVIVTQPRGLTSPVTALITTLVRNKGIINIYMLTRVDPWNDKKHTINLIQ